MGISVRELASALTLALVLAGCTTPGASSHGIASTDARRRTGRDLPRAVALVPLYSYPSGASVWQPLVTGHQGAPGIPVDAIVDVTSKGAGKNVDPNYIAGVAQLHQAGITVLGYVGTSYGRRALSAIEKEIAHWQAWYGVDGIFLDEMPAKAGHETLYTDATSYAKGLGLAPVIGNPGTAPAQSYEQTVDALVIWETKAYPSISYLSGGWFPQYDRSHYGFIAYGQQQPNAQFDDDAEQYVLYEFVTDGKGSNPYKKLPSYLDEFLDTL